MDRETRKFLTMIAILAACVLVFFLTPVRDWFSRERVADWARWVHGLGIAAPLLLAALLAATAVVGIPRMYLTILIGALFPIATSMTLSVAGSTIGAVGAFFFARFMGREFVERRLGRRFAPLFAILRDHGFSLVVLLRVVPFTNFAVTNYVCGVSTIRFPDYLLATALGMIPSTAMFVLLGRGLGNHDLRMIVAATSFFVVFTAVAILGFRRAFARRLAGEAGAAPQIDSKGAQPHGTHERPHGQEGQKEDRDRAPAPPAAPAATRRSAQAGGRA